MKMSEYAPVIAELAKKYPDAEVISSSDDEGNSFGPVHFHPSAGKFKGYEFDNDVKPNQVNAVCVN
jgi:hypothetical protein